MHFGDVVNIHDALEKMLGKVTRFAQPTNCGHILTHPPLHLPLEGGEAYRFSSPSRGGLRWGWVADDNLTKKPKKYTFPPQGPRLPTAASPGEGRWRRIW